MSDKFQCGDTAALVSYVYDEGDAGERAAVEAHLGFCAACSAELAALGSTRTHLASWTLPESDLGFQIVKRQTLGPRLLASPGSAPAPTGSRAWWNRPIPAWANVAAAALIFATGLTLGAVRGTGGGNAGEQATVASPSSTATPVSAGELAALERRLRDEITQVRTAVPAVSAPVAAPGSEAQVLSRVQTLIDEKLSESERRQGQQLALRINQAVTDFETQRRFDLTRFEQRLGDYAVTTGAAFRRQEDNVNMLMRVSQQGQGR